jgi:hypothetical protein
MNFTFSVKCDKYTDQTKNVPSNRFTTPTKPDDSYLKTLNLRIGSQDEEFEYTPTHDRFSYYQICGFASNDKYQVRKLIYNEMGEAVSIKTANVKNKKIQNFIKKCPKNRYCIIPVYELDQIEVPDQDSILLAMSPILNKCNDSGVTQGVLTY